MSAQSYFEPDPILFFEGIRSKEEFINAYLVKGNFGQSVPRDVKESFKTAEYLMAHSFFYTPMYDEAFRKVLGIHEMAVKLRCKELGIELLKRGKAGKKDQPKNLGTLHNELMKRLNLEIFRYTFDKVLEYRNEKAHPEKHAFGGTLYKMHIEMIVKFINLIFETTDSKTDPDQKEL